MKFTTVLYGSLIGTPFTEAVALILLAAVTLGVVVGIPMATTWGSDVVIDSAEVQSIAIQVLIVYVGVRLAIVSLATAFRATVGFKIEDVIIASLAVAFYWYLEYGGFTGQSAIDAAKPVVGTVGARLLKRLVASSLKELRLVKQIAMLCLQFHLVVRLAFVAYAAARFVVVLTCYALGFCKSTPLWGPGGLADMFPTLSIAGLYWPGASETSSDQSAEASSSGGVGDETSSDRKGGDDEHVGTEGGSKRGQLGLVGAASAAPVERVEEEEDEEEEEEEKENSRGHVGDDGGLRRRNQGKKGKGKNGKKGKGKRQARQEDGGSSSDDEDPLPVFMTQKRTERNRRR